MALEAFSLFWETRRLFFSACLDWIQHHFLQFPSGVVSTLLTPQRTAHLQLNCGHMSAVSTGSFLSFPFRGLVDHRSSQRALSLFWKTVTSLLSCFLPRAGLSTTFFTRGPFWITLSSPESSLDRGLQRFLPALFFSREDCLGSSLPMQPQDAGARFFGFGRPECVSRCSWSVMSNNRAVVVVAVPKTVFVVNLQNEGSRKYSPYTSTINLNCNSQELPKCNQITAPPNEWRFYDGAGTFRHRRNVSAVASSDRCKSAVMTVVKFEEAHLHCGRDINWMMGGCDN